MTRLELGPTSICLPFASLATISPSPVLIVSFSAMLSPALNMRSVPSSAIALTSPVTDCTVPALAIIFLRSVGFYMLMFVSIA